LAFDRASLFNGVEHSDYDIGSRPYTIDGDRVAIVGHLVPTTRLTIVWTRYGPGYLGREPSGNRRHTLGERVLSDEETARVMAAVASGRFAFLPTGPLDEFYLELVPVEYCPIHKRMEPNYAWRGMWEVA
jgi:hypothetical protein